MMVTGLYIGMSEKKGRGVFTRYAIPEGTDIETAPVIIMNEGDRELLDRTALHDYIFEWMPDGEKLCCMALGYVPIYNHANTSNCEYFMHYAQATITIRTVRDIAAGEELTINYNGDWNDERSVWFEVVP